MKVPASKTLFLQTLSDEAVQQKIITKTDAERIFTFFKQCSLFKWRGANNDCEDRANAVCLLLDEWNIPNCKGWILSGFFLKRGNGSLNNGWNYHVAPIVPVQEANDTTWYIIDPSTSDKLIAIENWAVKLTDQAYSYYFIKAADYYIFPSKEIEKNKWHKRDKRNYRWTMQGLSGINGMSSVGKARLIFKKDKIKNTEQRFVAMKLKDPFKL